MNKTISPELLKRRNDFIRNAEELFWEFVYPAWYDEVKDIINQDSWLINDTFQEHEVTDYEYPFTLYPNKEYEDGVEPFTMFELCVLAKLHYVEIMHEERAIPELKRAVERAVREAYEELDVFDKAIITIASEEEDDKSYEWAIKEVCNALWREEEDEIVDHLVALRDARSQDEDEDAD